MSLLSLAIAKNKVSKLNESGKVVVFTNGCFDIIHKGHITLLTVSYTHLTLPTNREV